MKTVKETNVIVKLKAFGDDAMRPDIGLIFALSTKMVVFSFEFSFSFSI